jgi:hypothetical protein
MSVVYGVPWDEEYNPWDRHAEESLTGVRYERSDPEAGLDAIFLQEAVSCAGPPDVEESTAQGKSQAVRELFEGTYLR